MFHVKHFKMRDLEGQVLITGKFDQEKDKHQNQSLQTR